MNWLNQLLRIINYKKRLNKSNNLNNKNESWVSTPSSSKVRTLSPQVINLSHIKRALYENIEDINKKYDATFLDRDDYKTHNEWNSLRNTFFDKMVLPLPMPHSLDEQENVYRTHFNNLLTSMLEDYLKQTVSTHQFEKRECGYSTSCNENQNILSETEEAQNVKECSNSVISSSVNDYEKECFVPKNYIALTTNTKVFGSKALCSERLPLLLDPRFYLENKGGEEAVQIKNLCSSNLIDETYTANKVYTCLELLNKRKVGEWNSVINARYDQIVFPLSMSHSLNEQGNVYRSHFDNSLASKLEEGFEDRELNYQFNKVRSNDSIYCNENSDSLSRIEKTQNAKECSSSELSRPVNDYENECFVLQSYFALATNTKIFGSKVLYLDKLPLSLDSRFLLKNKVESEIIQGKSLCFSHVVYETDIVNKVCTCPDFLNKRESGQWERHIRSYCIHLYEWLAYTENSHQLNREENEYRFTIITERTYERMLSISSGEAIKWIVPKFLKEMCRYFENNDTLNISKYEYSIESVTNWVDVYIEDIRYGFNVIKAIWTYHASESISSEVRQKIANEVLGYFYNFIGVKPEMRIITLDPIKRIFLAQVNFRDVVIDLETKARGIYVELSSDLLGKAKFHLTGQVYKFNNLDNYFYLTLQDRLTPLINSFNCSKQEVLDEEKARLKNIVKLKSGTTTKVLKSMSTRVLKSMCGLVSLGLKKKNGWPYFYITLINNDGRIITRLLKLKQAHVDSIPLDFIKEKYCELKLLRSDVSSYCWSDNDIEDFIRRRYKDYIDVINSVNK